MRKKIKGIAPMIYCFFNKENKMDNKLIIEQVNMINSMGVHGIACLGLGTEVNKLSFKEKVNIIEIVSKFKKSIIPKKTMTKYLSSKMRQKLVRFITELRVILSNWFGSLTS